MRPQATAGRAGRNRVELSSCSALRGIAAALSACAVVIVHVDALACDCIARPLSERYERADQVFVGEVVEAKDWLGVSATFQVKSQWKGVSTSEVVVHSGSSNCDIPFAIGQTFLVFASRGETSICARTEPVEQAEAVLDLLGPPFGGSETTRARWVALAVAGSLALGAAWSLLRRPRRLLLASASLLLATAAAGFALTRAQQQQQLEAAELRQLRDLESLCEDAARAAPRKDCTDSVLQRPEQVKFGFAWATPGGPFVATNWTHLCILDVRDRTALCSQDSTKGVASAVSADGTVAATADRGGLTIWTRQAQALVGRELAPSQGNSMDTLGFGGWCLALEFDPGGTAITVVWSRAAIGAPAWWVQRWDVTSGRLLSEWKDAGAPESASISTDGNLVAVARNSSTGSLLEVRDSTTGAVRATHARQSAALRPVLAFVGDSSVVHEARSRQLELLEMSGSELKRVWTRRTRCPIRAASASETGVLLTADGAQVLNPATGELKLELGGGTALGGVGRDAYLLRLEEGEPRVRRCAAR